jgi:hypothetical protein
MDHECSLFQVQKLIHVSICLSLFANNSSTAVTLLESCTYISDSSIMYHAFLSVTVFLSKTNLEKFMSSLLSKLPHGQGMSSSPGVQGYILEEYVRLSPRTTPLWFGTVLSKYEYLKCGICFPSLYQWNCLSSLKKLSSLLHVFSSLLFKGTCQRSMSSSSGGQVWELYEHARGSPLVAIIVTAWGSIEGF